MYIHGGSGLITVGLEWEVPANQWDNSNNDLLNGVMITTGAEGSVDVTGGDGLRVTVPSSSWAWVPDLGGVQLHALRDKKRGAKRALPIEDQEREAHALELLEQLKS